MKIEIRDYLESIEESTKNFKNPDRLKKIIECISKYLPGCHICTTVNPDIAEIKVFQGHGMDNLFVYPGKLWMLWNEEQGISISKSWEETSGLVERFCKNGNTK